MLVNRENMKHHLAWIVLAVALTAGAVVWYFSVALATSRWPGGSSFVGFVLGVVGGLIILFEFFLWPRKVWLRTRRIGKVKTWMAAHIWLGLACFPLLVLHSGFYLGGTLSTVLMVLLTLIIASGIWGLVLQQVIPKVMLAEIPSETIYSQIGHVMDLSRQEAERLVLATCGPVEGQHAAVEEPVDEPAPAYLVVGAQRTAGRTQGIVLQTQVPKAPVQGTEPLREFFRDQVVPFLRGGAATGSSLRSKNRAQGLFQALRTQLDPRAHATVEVLENLCEQRRQLDRQAQLHVWLHNWLLVHLPLSVALVVLMFVHVYVALKYW